METFLLVWIFFIHWTSLKNNHLAKSVGCYTSKQASYLPPVTSSTVAAANHVVEKELAMLEKNKRKHGEYHKYMGEPLIGHHAAENGNKSAVQKFSKSLGNPVNEYVLLEYR